MINIFSSTFIFSLVLFCFLLHYTLSLALTDQVTSALLSLHHALIMVCLRSPVTTYHWVKGAHRLCMLIHNQIPRTSKILLAKLRDDLILDQLRQNATSWTNIGVSLLILECQCQFQDGFQIVTEASSSNYEDLYWMKAFKDQNVKLCYSVDYLAPIQCISLSYLITKHCSFDYFPFLIKAEATWQVSFCFLFFFERVFFPVPC